MTLERAFCNVSETASAPIPDIAIVVNSDETPAKDRSSVMIERINIICSATLSHELR